MAGFIQLKRGATTEELMRHPECFLLLTLIAYRARRTNEGLNSDRLEIGQALIGDFKTIGLSSEKVYRTAKKKLENWNLAAFKGTNKGTVATLLNSEVYDINENDRGDQKGGQGATNGRTEGEHGADDGRTTGGQRATNNNGNKGKKENNGKNGKNVKINGSADLFEPEAAKICVPWQSAEFLSAWENWKKFKAGEFKFFYKTPQSEQAALLQLSKISDGIETEAIKIINESMAKGWKGLFALKTNQNGTYSNSKGISDDPGRKPIRDVTQQDIVNALNQKFGD